MKINLALLILLSFQSVTYASSYTVTSVPYQSSGFSYSNGQGSSISISTGRSLPVVMQDYPDAVWVPAHDGFIPANAIVYQYQNFAPVYYCKVEYEHKNYFGQILRGNQGCYIPDISDDQITNYWILVR